MTLGKIAAPSPVEQIIWLPRYRFYSLNRAGYAAKPGLGGRPVCPVLCGFYNKGAFVMTITLHVDSDTEASLRTAAGANGMSPEQYILSLLHGRRPPHARLSPEDRAALWIESAERFPSTPPLPHEAISRETMYGDWSR